MGLKSRWVLGLIVVEQDFRCSLYTRKLAVK